MRTSKIFGHEVNLIESEEDFTTAINRIKAEDKPRIGLDTETSGLDFVKDHIAGICFSLHPKNKPCAGYYLPLNHYNYHYSADKTRTQRFITWLLTKFDTFFFNRDFDYFFLEQFGVSIPIGCRSFDTQIAVWEATSEPMPSLKESAKDFLKIDMPTYIQTVSKTKTDDQLKVDFNFAKTDPTVTYTYGALDPIVTVLLAEHMFTKFPYIKKIFPLDNRASEEVRKFTKTHLAIDYNAVEEEREVAEAKIRQVQQQIFNITGYPFSLNSNRDKAEALGRFVTLTQKTKTGQLSVKSEVLEAIDHPLAKLLVKYAELSKFISSYINTTAETKNKSTRIRFNSVSAPTGRLAAGGAQDNSYFASINIQCVSPDDFIDTRFGKRRAGSIEIGDEVWTGFTFNKVLKKFNSNKDLYKVTFKEGSSIRVSKEHNLLTGANFQPLKELSAGDRVAFNSQPIPFEGSMEFPDEFYFFLGYMVGDGFIRTEVVKGVEYPHAVTVILNESQDLLRERLEESIHYKFSKTSGIKRTKNSQPLSRITIYNAALVRTLLNLGFKKGARNKEIPQFVKDGTIIQRKNFLAGLLSADGNIQRKKTSVRLTTSSEKLAYDFKEVSNSLGVISSVRKRKQPFAWDVTFSIRRPDLFLNLPDKVEYLRDENLHGKTYSRLPNSLKGLATNYLKEHKREGRTSNFVVVKKMEYYHDKAIEEELLLNYIEIEKIEFIGNCEVVDFHVEVTNRYCLNNFIVHNSIPKEEHVLFAHEDTLLGISLNSDPNNALGTCETKAGFRRCFNAPEGYVFFSADYCVTGDTLVITPEGEKQITSLREGEKVYTPKGFKPSSNLHSTGKRKVYKITLTTGETLKCSEDHLIFIKREGRQGWCAAKNIKDSDYIFSINANIYNYDKTKDKSNRIDIE